MLSEGHKAAHEPLEVQGRSGGAAVLGAAVLVLTLCGKWVRGTTVLVVPTCRCYSQWFPVGQDPLVGGVPVSGGL